MATPGKANAAQIKSFIYAQRWGVLATQSRSQQGFPFGSVVPYDVDTEGRICIYISFIAEHYKNLQEASEASLTVIDAFGTHDPQAYARACLLLRFTPVPESEKLTVQKSYEQRFPNSINYEIAHNFLFMRGVVERIRWIGGFGDIQWLGAENYRAVQPDHLAYGAWDVISHMNDDHEEALRSMVVGVRGSCEPKASVKMVSLTSKEFVVRVGDSKATDDVVIPFVRKIENAAELRAIMIETLKTSA